MTIITLTTDFGLKDGNVGVMKGVIIAIAPRSQIVDLSHQISPQNVNEAALILRRSAPYFPDGTIHLAVVDPGVGTDRRPIAAHLGTQYFVGPDNGLISLWLERLEEKKLAAKFYQLNQSQYWLSSISHVFHGRDIFAPVAAHLASGVPLEAMGTKITDPVRLEFPRPERTVNGWRGEVVHIDHFGNIGTNLSRDILAGQRVVTVHVDGVNIQGMASTFGDCKSGKLAAIFSSTDDLFVAEVDGNAAQRLGVKVGDSVEVIVGQP